MFIVDVVNGESASTFVLQIDTRLFEELIEVDAPFIPFNKEGQIDLDYAIALEELKSRSSK